MSQTVITEQERALIEHCKSPEIAILRHLDEKLVGQGVLLGCGDADRMIEGFDRHRGILRDKGIPDRIHPILVNGGPANFWQYPPTSVIGAFIIQNIFEGLELKEMDRLINYGHWPCGKAREQGLGLLDVLQSLSIVKRHVKGLDASVEVALYLHIDWLCGRMNTYHVNHPNLLKHLNDLVQKFPSCTKFSIAA